MLIFKSQTGKPVHKEENKKSMRPLQEKKVTIDDVARLSGVSKTTVSRYLNGKYDAFSEKTRCRIEETIRELDYHPDRSAQRLKSSKTRLIGCIIADISSPFSAQLLKGVTAVCEARGYQVLFADCDEDSEKEARIIQGLIENRVDGLIVNTTGRNNELLFSTAEKGTPVVMADRRLIGERQLDTVEHANREVSCKCVKLLADFGYNRVAFFTHGNGNIAPRILIYEGYLDGMRDYFPEVEPLIYQFDKNNEDDCIRCIREFRDRFPDERIAILTVNGIASQKVLLAFSKTDYEIGYEYGLCSFDDWEWLKLSPPGITSVLLPSYKIGAKSAEILLDNIQNGVDPGREPVNIMLPGTIHVRGSTTKEKKI